MLQKNDVAKLQEEFTAVINPTKKITDLKAQLEFSDTFQNKVNLADAYLENKQYKEAVEHYRNALDGNFSNDIDVKIQLIKCYQALGDQTWIIDEAESIKDHSDFLKSPVALYYGLALDSAGRSEEAQPFLDKVDQRYSNYPERVKLAAHYADKNQTAKAREILEEIMTEAGTMGKESRRMHKVAVGEAQKLLQEL